MLLNREHFPFFKKREKKEIKRPPLFFVLGVIHLWEDGGKGGEGRGGEGRGGEGRGGEGNSSSCLSLSLSLSPLTYSFQNACKTKPPASKGQSQRIKTEHFFFFFYFFWGKERKEKIMTLNVSLCMTNRKLWLDLLFITIFYFFCDFWINCWNGVVATKLHFPFFFLEFVY